MVDVYDSSKKSSKKSSGSRKSVNEIKGQVRKGGSESIFTSFVTFPRQICFDTQEEGEEIVLFLRQHPIVNVGWVLFSLLLSAIPSIFIFFPPYADLPSRFQMILVLVWYLLLFGFMLSKLMHWFYTILIATDERLLDVDLVNLFYREVSDMKIDRIQDINSIMSGSWHTTFNYGHVVVQTAGESPEFRFQNVPRPDDVVEVINTLVELEEQEKIEGRVK